MTRRLSRSVNAASYRRWRRSPCVGQRVTVVWAGSSRNSMVHVRSMRRREVVRRGRVRAVCVRRLRRSRCVGRRRAIVATPSRSPKWQHPARSPPAAAGARPVRVPVASVRAIDRWFATPAAAASVANPSMWASMPSHPSRGYCLLDLDLHTANLAVELERTAVTGPPMERGLNIAERKSQ